MDSMRSKRSKALGKSHIPEIVIIIIIILCLGIGFIVGYTTKREVRGNKKNNNGNIAQEVYTILDNKWYNLQDKGDVKGKVLSGMVSGLEDPHSSFFTNTQSQEFNQEVNGDFEGVGVTFSPIDRGALVVKVLENSPAKEVGILSGDIITHVNDTSLQGLTNEKIKGLVRGKPDTKVTIKLLRNEREIVVKPIRHSISTAVSYSIREHNKKKFGYISITTFGSSTGKEVEAALQKFEEHHIKSLVIDVRDNGGGYLSAAVDILQLFLKEGETLYQIQQKGGPIEKKVATKHRNYTFDKGYILMNGSTASASEMVAGALHQQLGFTLIGTKSFGKGSAQTQANLSDGSVVKYTYAKWMTPNGFCVNGVGLKPDIDISNYDLHRVVTKKIEEPLHVDQVSQSIIGMQDMLQILGYAPGRQDGYFSIQTETALKQFQKDHGLESNGQYDSNNQQVLIAQTLLFTNKPENDVQYKRMLEVI